MEKQVLKHPVSYQPLSQVRFQTSHCRRRLLHRSSEHLARILRKLVLVRKWPGHGELAALPACRFAPINVCSLDFRGEHGRAYMVDACILRCHGGIAIKMFHSRHPGGFCLP